MSKACNICGKPKSQFVMNNKTVCMRCDELLFDIEIECEEEIQGTLAEKAAGKTEQPAKRIIQIAKK